MITHDSLGFDGRFGNQLFQYAALKSLALTNLYEVHLPDFTQRSWHGQNSLLDQLNIPDKQVANRSWQYDYQCTDHFNEDFFKIPDGTNLHGYFQDVRYFLPHLDTIKTFMMPNVGHIERTKSLLKFYSKYKKHDLTVSVHIRLGDCVSMPPACNIYGPIMLGPPYRAYLDMAMEIFGNNADYFVFAGGSRGNNLGQGMVDIELSKQLMARYGVNTIRSIGNTTIEDYGLMQHCDANILSPLTTFGLWVGYTADKQKTIVAPKDYYMGTEPSLVDRQLYLNNWITL